MEPKARLQHDEGSAGIGSCGVDTDSGLTDRDKTLRASVLTHIKWIHTFDPDYAKSAYNRYREELSWLALPAPKN